MPVYEYHCDACGKDFEAQQRMSDAPLTECSCGEKGQVRRLIGSGAGLIFKGSGFYITDYKNGGSKAGEAKESAPKSESKSESSSPAPTCGAGACPACQ
ncbi:MAG: zinc ribbon domain-containing protein [Candidatus Sumerlaeia bacterium]|nr:zinc ribbon domain-containing protein [Candidatus Sumerlaeia bacterium]